MIRIQRSVLIALVASAFSLITAVQSTAGTILKLNLGGTGPDVGMNAMGTYSTLSDGDGSTTGDQNTDIEFTDFLDGSFTDVPTAVASFSIANVNAVGAPDVSGSLVTQNFFGGTIRLYDSMNNSLLEANLQDSAVVGTVGTPGVAGFFTVTLGQATGGALASYIEPGSISMSMPLTDVNNGMGLLVIGNVLQPFDADASANISANPIPEPAAVGLLFLAGIFSTALFRRR